MGVSLVSVMRQVVLKVPSTRTPALIVDVKRSVTIIVFDLLLVCSVVLLLACKGEIAYLSTWDDDPLKP